MIRPSLILAVISGIILSAVTADARNTAALCGFILDATEHPIRGAIIRIPGTSPSRDAISKIDGTFLVANIPKNVYDIQISRVGYATSTVYNVIIDIPASALIRVILEPRTAGGDSIFVTAQHDIICLEGTEKRSSITFGNRKPAVRTRISGAVAIGSLQPGGSTVGAAGINPAHDIAKEDFLADGNYRVIPATDGDFNVGISDPDNLEKLIEKRGKESTSPCSAPAITRMRVWNVWRTKDAGELGAGHSVTSLYEIELHDGDGDPEMTPELPGIEDPSTTIPGAPDSSNGQPRRPPQPERPGLGYHATSGMPVRPAAGADTLMYVKLRYRPPTSDESRLLQRWKYSMRGMKG